MQTPRSVAIATNAFGMGINKPDLRFVVHYNMPGTLEAYYQEAGRAGRDGLPARCIILFNYQDRYTQEFFIDKMGEEFEGEAPPDPVALKERQEHARRKLELMIRYAQTHRCRRQQILDYFGDELEIDRATCHCDVCRVQRGEHDANGAQDAGQSVVISDESIMLVRQLLSAIARLRGRFGVGMVADVLIGSENEKVRRWGMDQLSVYGLLKAHSGKRVIAMLHRLMEAGLARQRDPEGTKFMPVVELTAAGVSVMKGEQLPPSSLADLSPRRRATAVRHEVLDAGRKVHLVRDGEEARNAADDGGLDPEAAERFERLRKARLELARQRQLPPYCICHDTTLKAMARQAPRDIGQLEQIKGMGPYKIQMYAEALLRALWQP